MILHKGVEGETYNIGCHEETTNQELSEKLVKLIYPEVSDVNKYIQYVQDRPFNDVRYYLNFDKLLSLGWAPEFTFEQGLAKTIEWYKSVTADWWPIGTDSALAPHPVAKNEAFSTRST